MENHWIDHDTEKQQMNYNKVADEFITVFYGCLMIFIPVNKVKADPAEDKINENDYINI